MSSFVKNNNPLALEILMSRILSSESLYIYERIPLITALYTHQQALAQMSITIQRHIHIPIRKTVEFFPRRHRVLGVLSARADKTSENPLPYRQYFFFFFFNNYPFLLFSQAVYFIRGRVCRKAVPHFRFHFLFPFFFTFLFATRWFFSSALSRASLLSYNLPNLNCACTRAAARGR